MIIFPPPAKLDGIPLKIFLSLSALLHLYTSALHRIAEGESGFKAAFKEKKSATTIRQIEDVFGWVGKRKPSECWLKQIGVHFLTL